VLAAERFERQFGDDGEESGRHGPPKDEAGVVECQAGDNRLPQTARPDEGRERNRPREFAESVLVFRAAAVPAPITLTRSSNDVRY